MAEQVWRPSVRPVQCESTTHSTHAPARVALEPEQYGVGCRQSVSRKHPLAHTPGVIGSAELQASAAGQPLCPSPGQHPSRQRWLDGSQMRPESEAPQSLSTAHPQRRVPSASAMHAVPSRLIAQSADAEPGTQATQRFDSGSHVGVDPVHADMLAVVHCTQRPASRPIVAHAGVGATQSVGFDGEHGRHMRVDVSQMGVAPAQSALLVQPTQVLVARSHTPERQSRLAPVRGVPARASAPGCHAGRRRRA